MPYRLTTTAEATALQQLVNAATGIKGAGLVDPKIGARLVAQARAVRDLIDAGERDAARLVALDLRLSADGDPELELVAAILHRRVDHAASRVWPDKPLSAPALTSIPASLRVPAPRHG